MSDTKTMLADPLDVMARLLTFAGKQNPYPLYEEMRRHGPLADAGSGHVFATGYEECAQALREPDLLSTDDAVQDRKLPGWREHSSWRWLTKNMLFANDPNHERYRRFFASAFSARSVEQWRPMVERIADEAVERVARLIADDGVVDLVPEFSFRFPMAVIGELLAVPEQDRPHLREVIGGITSALDPIGDLSQLNRGDAAMGWLAEYFGEIFARKRAAPGDDLLTALIRARDAGGELSEEEFLANVMLLLVAATEAPQDLLSNMVRLAIEHPDYAARARSDQRVAEGFVEETLRFDPAAQALNRVAARDMDYFGVRLAEGTSLILLIAAGNRDPRRFAEPGRFDPTRSHNQSLTLSGGAHFCLGAALARMSMADVLPKLLRRLPGLELAGRPTFRDQIVQRGHDHLPVTA